MSRSGRKRRDDESALVWSSDGGRVRDHGRGDADADGAAGTGGATPPADGVVRVGRETKGRKGKGVTVVTGAPLAAGELADLARSLKAQCGSGGTVRDGVIEIQGDHRDRVVALLQARGWTVRRAGG